MTNYDNESPIMGFLKQNLWVLLVTLVGISMTWATLNARVNVMAQEHTKLDEKLEKIEDLTERLIVLEEARRNQDSNIVEIKNDIKDIKRHFEIDGNN